MSGDLVELATRWAARLNEAEDEEDNRIGAVIDALLDRIEAQEAEIRSLREQVAKERAGRMPAIDAARYRVSKWIAESHGGSYLIPGYLRGELDDSAAIQNALAAIEAEQDKEPRA